ncbi:MAG TPA: MFS transporter, partial [Casimicrobiaceae bacterium]|nr:MFS transporter [Casimicrobiaceae bacterium]
MSARDGGRPGAASIAVLMAATFPGPFCYSAIGVAVPTLAREFRLTPNEVQWAASAFITAMMGGMLVASALLARHGLARSLAIAGTGFAVAAAGAAAAPSFAAVVALQFVMGSFAGLMQPIALVTLYRLYPDALRGRATSIYGLGISMVSTLAPTLAGTLIDAWSWRGLFVVPIPLALCGLLAARRVRDAPRERRAVPDIGGLVGLWIALLALLAIDVRGERMATVVLPLGVALAAFVAVGWRLARARHPLIDPHLFRYPGFVAASLLALLYGALMFGLIYLVPIYMQLALGASPTMAGAAQIPAGVALAVAVVAGGRAIDRWAYRPVLAGGLLVLATSCALLGFPALSATVLAATVWSATGRIGIGLIFSGLNTGATRVVPDERMPEVPGVVNFFRLLGGALGVKALSLVIDARLAGAGGTARADAFSDAFLLLALLALAAVPLARRMRS